MDLQKKNDEYGLNEGYRSYKNRLSHLATVFEFDYENPMTEDRENFTDPYHFADTVGRLIVAIATGKSAPDSDIVRVSKKDRLLNGRE